MNSWVKEKDWVPQIGFIFYTVFFLSLQVDDSDDDDNDDDSDESDENGQATSSPPVIETTLIPIINGRGDSIGYHSDYKKNGYYVDGNNIEKGPSSYKSYGSDKAAYDGADLKVYKVKRKLLKLFRSVH